jgi:hypothetical protein
VSEKWPGIVPRQTLLLAGSQPSGTDAIEKVVVLNANLTIDEISVTLQRISRKFCIVTALSNDREC